MLVQSKLVFSDSNSCLSTEGCNQVCCNDCMGICCPDPHCNKIYCRGTSPTLGECPLTPPEITIQSPQNITYETSSIWANVTLDKEGSWCGRNLDESENITMTNSSGNWNNLMTSVINDVHNVTFCCNDTNDNMNCSDVEYFTVNKTDFEPPNITFSNDTSGGSVLTGTIVNISTLWYDNKGLSVVYFLHNETGSWIYDSCAISTNPQWCNFTLSTAGYEGRTICWYQNATDVSGNSAIEDMHCFSVTSTVSVGSNIENPLQSVRKEVSSSTAEFTTKFLTLAFQFFGIIILVVLLVLVVQQLVQSHG